MTTNPTCRTCGQPMPLLNSSGQPRQFCSVACSSSEQVQRWAGKRAELIEDVEWMLGTGESPEQVVIRLDSTGPAVARRLHRAGRHDLARRFDGMQDRPRHPCPDCGKPCRASSCVSCAARRREARRALVAA